VKGENRVLQAFKLRHNLTLMSLQTLKHLFWL